MKNKKFPHYWGCRSCFEEMGGVIKAGNATAIEGTCAYCHGQWQNPGEALFPWVDYDWPADHAIDMAAKANRD